MPKGVSDIIAMLLILIITIGLAGLAYSYISGVFTQKTSVVLSIDAGATSCASGSGPVTAYISNSGTQTSATVTVTLSGTGIGTASCTLATGSANIPSGQESSWSCPRTGGTTGTYTITATSVGASSVRGTVYCSS